jgi:hypothetical protein
VIACFTAPVSGKCNTNERAPLGRPGENCGAMQNRLRPKHNQKQVLQNREFGERATDPARS